MDPPHVPLFRLRYIRLCRSGEERTQPFGIGPPTNCATEVVLQIGPSVSSPSPPEVGGTVVSDISSSPSSLTYTCPAYLLESGCPALRELLVDAYDRPVEAKRRGSTAGTGNTSEDTEERVDAASAMAEVPSLSPSAPAHIPLPFLDKSVFEVVALFLERFHAVDFTDPAAGLDGAASHTPSVLRRPLHFQDLYALSSWERAFVLQQLLGIDEGEVATLGLAADGAWVDLLAGTATVKDGEAAPQGLVAPAAKEDMKLHRRRVSCFSLARRQRMWVRVCRVLEAAARLGMSSLQLLCATVAADMLIDLDETGLSQLMSTSSDDGDGGNTALPPFTPDARAQLLQRFPWLSP